MTLCLKSMDSFCSKYCSEVKKLVCKLKQTQHVKRLNIEIIKSVMRAARLLSHTRFHDNMSYCAENINSQHFDVLMQQDEK